MTEKIKTMGRLEWGIGVVFTAIITSYIIPGVTPPIELIYVAALFSMTYFGHWAFTLFERWLSNRMLLEQMKLRRDEIENKTTSQNTSSGNQGYIPGE